MAYVVPLLGLPSFVTRRKYGASLSGPLVVTVQPLTLRAHRSAVFSHAFASFASPCWRAMAAPVTSPSIWAAMVAGE